MSFEVLVHFLRYIRYNKTLGLKYYADRNDANLSNSSWKYCPDTGRSRRAYIIFYQDGRIDHGTYVPVQVAQSSS